mgnify:CR=1 FL=1
MTARITIAIPIAILLPNRLRLFDKTNIAPIVPKIRLIIFFFVIDSSGSIKCEKTATVIGKPDQIIEERLE